MHPLRFFFSFSCILLFLSISYQFNIPPQENSSIDSVVYLPLVMKDFGITPTETPTASATGPRPTRTKTPTATRTQTRTSTPFRSSTPIPTSTITPTVTITPTATFTATLTPTTTYVPLPEFTLIYPTFTPSITSTRITPVEATITQTPLPFIAVKSNQTKLGILASIGLVWILLAAWLFILIRRTQADED